MLVKSNKTSKNALIINISDKCLKKVFSPINS